LPVVELAPIGLDMTDFEESIKEDIPCGGCNQPAHWRSLGHVDRDCGGDAGNQPPPYYKCTVCYAAWRLTVNRRLASEGTVGCMYCHRRFKTLEEFSDYRRF
jgi:hypothetical protein